MQKGKRFLFILQHALVGDKDSSGYSLGEVSHGQELLGSLIDPDHNMLASQDLIVAKDLNTLLQVGGILVNFDRVDGPLQAIDSSKDCAQPARIDAFN